MPVNWRRARRSSSVSPAWLIHSPRARRAPRHRVRRDGFRGLGAPAGEAHCPGRARARAGDAAARAGPAHGRRTHRRRRARERAGRVVRGRARAGLRPERAAAAGRRRAVVRARRTTGSARAATPSRVPTGTACCTAGALAVRARRALLWPHRVDAIRSTRARRRWPARRPHRLHPDRDAPPALRAGDRRGVVAARAATS